MLAQERQAIIIDHLREHRFIKITDIASRFGISSLTARRDLDALQDQQIVRRVHGGAILVRELPEQEQSGTLTALLKNNDLSKENVKQEIGRMAASLVQEGDVLYLGHGTTVLEVARNLKHMSNLTIITGCLMIVNEMAATSNTLYVLGGQLDAEENFISGSYARQMVSDFCVDKTIISCSGVSIKHGLTAQLPQSAEMGRLVIENAAQTIVVCGSQKFDYDALCITCPLTEIDTLITDDGLSPDLAGEIRQMGVDLRLVESHAEQSPEE